MRELDYRLNHAAQALALAQLAHGGLHVHRRRQPALRQALPHLRGQAARGRLHGAAGQQPQRSAVGARDPRDVPGPPHGRRDHRAGQRARPGGARGGREARHPGRDPRPRHGRGAGPTAVRPSARREGGRCCTSQAWAIARWASVVADMQNRPMRRRIEGFEAGLEASGPGGAPARAPCGGRPPPAPPSTQSRSCSRARCGPPRWSRSAPACWPTCSTPSPRRACAFRRTSRSSPWATPDFARSHHPPISSVTVDLDRAAEDGVRMLLERMRDAPDAPPRRALAPMRFVLRGSSEGRCPRRPPEAAQARG